MNVHVPYTQAGRMMAVKSVLGDDALLLEHLEVREGLNQLFTIRATVRSQSEEVKPDAIVGTSADITLTLSDGETKRTWNGLVTELHEGPILTHGARRYALVMRPRLWLMSRRSDCRIFLEQTTLQVIETLCKEHGIKDLDLGGITSPPERQLYAVQWNETDLAYLLRRVEEDGLFYWFEHAEGKHTLTFGDHASAYRKTDPEKVRIAFGSADDDHIHDWRRQLSFTPGRRAGKDYEFLTPNLDLAANTPSIDKLPGNADYELYEYPARALTREAGETASRLRVQSTETDFDRIEGRSSVRTLTAGHSFTPYEVAHPDHAYPAQVVASILHQAEDATYETGAGSPHYENEFETLPASRPATPHRSIARPRIDGLQIAKVAGPSGEEIHTDPFGRVKLTFPWDRRAKGDGTDTGWVRVSQSWGGTTWGQQIIPRVGMEAMVAYQEGDPDRPIVVSIVPNPNNPVPYKLPDHKTKLVVRSDTYKGTGYNEISMEDVAGGENLFTHAQKDMTTKVLNDATQRIDANHVQSVGANHSLEVASNQNQSVGGSRSLTVGAVGGAATSALGAAMSGLSGQTQGLLGEAMSTAMQAVGAAGGGGGGSGGGSGFDASSLMGLASMFGGLIGGGGIGGLMGGGVDPLRGGVNDASASSMLQGGGAGMAGAASQLAGMVGQMMGGGSGIMNTMVSNMRNDSTGIASTEQVGMSKVVNVGQTYATQVGKAWSLSVGESSKTQIGKTEQVIVGEASETQVGKTKTIDVGQIFEITAGEKFMITVGECRLQMDKSGTVTITAPQTTIVKGGGAQFTIGPGPILYIPELVKGGGGAPPGTCLRRMAQAGVPFVAQG